jgi:hypothetical protein
MTHLLERCLEDLDEIEAFTTSWGVHQNILNHAAALRRALTEQDERAARETARLILNAAGHSTEHPYADRYEALLRLEQSSQLAPADVATLRPQIPLDDDPAIEVIARRGWKEIRGYFSLAERLIAWALRIHTRGLL